MLDINGFPFCLTNYLESWFAKKKTLLSNMLNKYNTLRLTLRFHFAYIEVEISSRLLTIKTVLMSQITTKQNRITQLFCTKLKLMLWICFLKIHDESSRRFASNRAS